MKQNIDLHHWARTIVIPIICIGIVIFNIFYIILCIKTLDKSFQNLVVIGLCFSDLVTGFQITVTSFSTFYFPKNIPSCILQTFSFSFGILLSYCLIFLLCLQRYLTVRSYNYCTKKAFDEIKLKCIGGTITAVFLYTLCTVSRIPQTGAISYCRHYKLYGDYVGTFVVTILGPAVILILVIVCISLLTSLQIWKIFFSRRKINDNSMTNYNRKEDQTSVELFVLDQNEKESNRQAMMNKGKGFLNDEKHIKSRSNVKAKFIQPTFKTKRQVRSADNPKDRQKKIVLIETSQPNMTIERINDDCQHRNMLDNGEIVQPENIHLNFHSLLRQHQFKHTEDNQQNQEATHIKQEVENGHQSNCFIAAVAATNCTTNLAVHVANEKQNANNSAIQDRSKLFMAVKEDNSSIIRVPAEINQPDLILKSRILWEIRAFITCIVIVVQTLLLTGPFVLSFWIELIYPQEISSQMYMFAIPFLVNILTNPILYVWRIPEIRREFKNLCKRNN